MGNLSAELFYFEAACTSFRVPDKGAGTYNEKTRRSVVGAFNLFQQAEGLPDM